MIWNRNSPRSSCSDNAHYRRHLATYRLRRAGLRARRRGSDLPWMATRSTWTPARNCTSRCRCGSGFSRFRCMTAESTSRSDDGRVTRGADLHQTLCRQRSTMRPDAPGHDGSGRDAVVSAGLRAATHHPRPVLDQEQVPGCRAGLRDGPRLHADGRSWLPSRPRQPSARQPMQSTD